MKTPIHSYHPTALGAPTFATAVAALRSCLRPCLTPCAPSASSSTGGSAKQTRHHVNFFCDAPRAKSVWLVGDFNGWDSAATPMQRTPDGRWMASLELHHGHHRYRFIVDGDPKLDPNATGIARDDQNNRVSLIAVS